MKFSDGCWLNKEGFTPHCPMEVNRISHDDKGVRLLVPCREIRHRGDTLEGPVLEYSFSSPLDNVIKVRLQHFRGGIEKGPHFDLKDDAAGQLEYRQKDTRLEIQSGGLEARIQTDSWNMEFRFDGRFLTGSGYRDAAYIEQEHETAYMREKLKISVGEQIYGLGERFTPFVKNGQTVDIWNRDGGTGTEQSYKNIPFYLSGNGYGLLVNHSEEVSFEVGSETVSRVQFSVEGEYLEYYIIGGESLKDVLSSYTAFSGRAAIPPAWSFGLWLTTSFTTEYDEATVTSFINGMKERDIPLDVFHFDCFWMKEYNWCDFQFDPDVFPEPDKMIQRLRDEGRHLSLWINPYVGQASPLFDEGRDAGFFLKRPNGDVWQWDLWQPGMAIVDFTNPDARSWYQDKLRPLLELGIDSLKTDFGERIPLDVVYHDGSDPRKMHNYYCYLYNKTVFELVQEVHGKDRAVLFARSATVGSQKFPIHWGGDSTSDYESMAESLRGGLSLGLSGFSFWSHDMGGFESTSTADVYKRWAAFGLLSSHSRLHGSSSYRVPWLYDDEAVDVVRSFAKLKNSLMPYIYSCAVESSRTGLPLMRPMLLEFPEDPVAQNLDRQYMLGPSLLVAPVFNPQGTVEYYLPEGRWTHLLSGEIREGGRFYKEQFDYMSLPLYARAGAIIPWNDESDRAEYDYMEDSVFRLFLPAEDSSGSFTVYTADNREAATMDVIRKGGVVEVHSESDNPLSLELSDFTAQSRTSTEEDERRFTCSAGKSRLTLELKT